MFLLLATQTRLLYNVGMPTKLSEEDFNRFVEEINRRDIFPRFKYVDYSNARKKYCWECKCGNVWYSMWDHVKNHRSGCPTCGTKKQAHAMRLSEDVFNARIYKINSRGIDCLFSYYDFVGTHTKYSFRCQKCGYVWKGSLDSIMSGKGCAKCARNIPPSELDFSSILEDLNKRDIKPQFSFYDYKGNKKNYCWLCLRCDHKWSATWDHVKNHRSGCPVCKHKNEKRIIDTIEGILMVHAKRQYKFSDCKDKKPLPFDAFFPDHNLLVEVQGPHHYEPTRWTYRLSEDDATKRFTSQQKRDCIKREFASKNGYKLVEVPYLANDNSISNMILGA